MHLVFSCMDKVTVWAWTLPPACKREELSTCKRITRCVHYAALAILTVGTVGVLHIATYAYLAYRIQSTDLGNTPLYNPAVRRTALFLHADMCRQFALTYNAPSLSDAQHAFIMRLLGAPLTQLTARLLDASDTRSPLEKYQSFVQECETEKGNINPPSEYTFQQFARTLLTQLVPSASLGSPHALFKAGKDGHYLSLDPALSEQALLSVKEQCREIGTLLGMWLSNAELVKYSIGPFFSVNFYTGLLWFLESPRDLNTPFHTMSEARRQELYVLLAGMDTNSPLSDIPFNLLCETPGRCAKLLDKQIHHLWSEILSKTGTFPTKKAWLDGLQEERHQDVTKAAIKNYLSATYQPRCAALQEVAQAFHQVYRAGIGYLMRPDLASACLVATLLQGQAYGPQNGIKLIEAVLTPELPKPIQEKARALIQAFTTTPATLYPFLLTLHRVELAAPPQAPDVPLPYGRNTYIIQAINEHRLATFMPLEWQELDAFIE